MMASFPQYLARFDHLSQDFWGPGSLTRCKLLPAFTIPHTLAQTQASRCDLIFCRSALSIRGWTKYIMGRKTVSMTPVFTVSKLLVTLVPPFFAAKVKECRIVPVSSF